MSLGAGVLKVGRATKRSLEEEEGTEATCGILTIQRLNRKSKGKAKMLQETEAKNGCSSKQEIMSASMWSTCKDDPSPVEGSGLTSNVFI